MTARCFIALHSILIVIPAKAGIHHLPSPENRQEMDSRLRGNDENVKTLYPFQHQRSRRLGAADDPGDTCARMRPRADEVKLGNRVVPIVGAADRKGVVAGKRVSVRVDLRGSCTIQKKKTN